MSLPSYIVKQILLAYEDKVGAIALYLSETCKTWKNIVHELWLEEKRYHYVVSCRLLPRLLARDNRHAHNLDLIVTVIERGSDDDLRTIQMTNPIMNALLAHSALWEEQNTSIDVSIKDQVFRDLWRECVLTLCANADRCDLLVRVKSYGYYASFMTINPYWSEKVQQFFHHQNVPERAGAACSPGLLNAYHSSGTIIH